jgi:hypothetical protein
MVVLSVVKTAIEELRIARVRVLIVVSLSSIERWLCMQPAIHRTHMLYRPYGVHGVLSSLAGVRKA